MLPLDKEGGYSNAALLSVVCCHLQVAQWHQGSWLEVLGAEHVMTGGSWLQGQAASCWLVGPASQALVQYVFWSPPDRHTSYSVSLPGSW